MDKDSKLYKRTVLLTFLTRSFWYSTLFYIIFIEYFDPILGLFLFLGINGGHFILYFFLKKVFNFSKKKAFIHIFTSIVVIVLSSLFLSKYHDTILLVPLIGAIVFAAFNIISKLFVAKSFKQVEEVVE